MIFTDEDGMTAALCIILIHGAIRRRGINWNHASRLGWICSCISRLSNFVNY